MVERFSLLSIFGFQPIRNSELFFIAKTERIPGEFGAVGIAMIRKEALEIIKESEINQLTRNYQEGIKSMRKIVRSYFKSKES